MIPKSGYRFSEKIMLKQHAKAKWRFNLKSFRFSLFRTLECELNPQAVPHVRGCMVGGEVPRSSHDEHASLLRSNRSSKEIMLW
jgi:hypothetical protein